jgi:hypothetical protein
MRHILSWCSSFYLANYHLSDYSCVQPFVLSIDPPTYPCPYLTVCLPPWLCPFVIRSACLLHACLRACELRVQVPDHGLQYICQYICNGADRTVGERRHTPSMRSAASFSCASSWSYLKAPPACICIQRAVLSHQPPFTTVRTLTLSVAFRQSARPTTTKMC